MTENPIEIGLNKSKGINLLMKKNFFKSRGRAYFTYIWIGG